MIADISYSATDITNRIADISYSATDITNRKANFSNSVKKKDVSKSATSTQYRYILPIEKQIY